MMLDENDLNGDAPFDDDDARYDGGQGVPEPAEPGATVTDGDAPESKPDLRALAGGKAPSGKSVEARAADGEGAEEEEKEMFPIGSLAGDSKFSPLSIFKKRHKFRVKSKVKAVSVPMTGDGMLNPEGHNNLAITNRLSSIRFVPEFDDRFNIVGWDVVQEFLPTHVEKLDGALPDTATG